MRPRKLQRHGGAERQHTDADDSAIIALSYCTVPRDFSEQPGGWPTRIGVSTTSEAPSIPGEASTGSRIQVLYSVLMAAYLLGFIL